MRSICKGGIYEEFVNSKKFSLPEGERGGPPGGGDGWADVPAAGGGGMGRRCGGRGSVCSRRGACPAGMHPPFSFPSCGKENGPCTVQKKRPLLVATLHIRAKLLYGSRRIGASTDLALPSGTLGPSARSVLPSRGGWCPDRRGAKPHLRIEPNFFVYENGEYTAETHRMYGGSFEKGE